MLTHNSEYLFVSDDKYITKPTRLTMLPVDPFVKLLGSYCHTPLHRGYNTLQFTNYAGSKPQGFAISIAHPTEKNYKPVEIFICEFNNKNCYQRQRTKGEKICCMMFILY